jgi:WD40 repeat protein
MPQGSSALRVVLILVAGATLASGGDDRTMEGISHTATTSGTLSLRGRTILSIGGAGAALYDLDTGHPVQTFAGFQDALFGMSLSPDGRMVATATSNAGGDFNPMPFRHQIQVWDVGAGKVLARIDAEVWPGMTLGWTADGNVLFAPAQHGTRLWEAASGLELGSLPGAVRFSPRGDSVLVWGDGKAAVLSYPGRVKRCEFDVYADTGLRFSGDGKTITAVVRATTSPPPYGGPTPYEVREWDSGTCRMVHSFPVAADTFSAASFVPDGRAVLVNLSKPATAVLLDATNGDVLRTYSPDQGQFMTDVLLSPDGERLLTAWSYYRKTDPREQYFCSLWDVRSGTELHRWAEDWRGDSCAGFSGDSQSVPVMRQGRLASLWSARTGLIVREYP